MTKQKTVYAYKIYETTLDAQGRIVINTVVHSRQFHFDLLNDKMEKLMVGRGLYHELKPFLQQDRDMKRTEI